MEEPAMTQSTSFIVSPRARLLIVALVVIGGAWAIRYFAGVEGANAKPPIAAAKPGSTKGNAPSQPTEPIVALVNGQTILHGELAQECLRHHGKEVLESLVNRRLIDKHCRSRGITVTQQEIDDEIDRIARKFSLPKDQYLTMLAKERDIKPAQYGKDIIWPTLALRKLAAAQLTVTPEELNEAYESQFGPAVKARLIVLETQAEAQKVLALARKNPNEFGALARKYSKDVNSASANGLIQPIRRHLGDPKIEQAAFALRPGQISSVVPVGDQFAILLCEELVAPAQVDRQKYDVVLTEAIKDRKLRAAASDTFKQLQDSARIVNVMNNAELRQQHPGVAALVNGEPITLKELGDQCAERHGKEVLDGLVHRKLLEQALSRRKLNVTDADLQEEVARAAISMNKVDPETGKPDIRGWIETVKATQGISEDVYLKDIVWPSTAMKKIVGNSTKISEDDLKKGFEANYGPRVRCRAILFNSQRKAQEVWDMARQEPTAQNFGDLAEQYSIEANSRSLRGEIPPIQKWGGQPVLEREAFSLQPGDISGVVQVGENFAILFCEGYTKPVNVDYKTVRDRLFADILEKKQRMAMADTFDKIKADATIDNYLAGTSQSPDREKELLDAELAGQAKARSAGRPTNTAQSAPRR
jgi:parvulin-like peptidyl-prolyl isomerase